MIQPVKQNFGAKAKGKGQPASGSTRPKQLTSDNLVGKVFVRVTGVPWELTDVDVLSYFQAYEPTGVLMGKFPNSGNASGEAAIGFDTQANAQRAINDLNNFVIGERYLA